MISDSVAASVPSLRNASDASEFQFELTNQKHIADVRARDLSSRSLPERARTNVEDDDASRTQAKTELQAIANEMRALRAKQRRQSNKRGSFAKGSVPETISERQPSAGSRASSGSHSGVRYDADVSHCDSDTGFSDKSDDVTETPTSSELAKNASGDRANLRKISATKRKKSPKEPSKPKMR